MWSQYLKKTLVNILVFALMVVPENWAIPVRTIRSVANPCGVLTAEGPVEPTPFNENINRLLYNTADFKQTIKDTIDFIKSDLLMGQNVGFLDDTTFLEKEKMTANESQKKESVADPVKALQTNMNFSAELFVHMNYIMNDAWIGSSDSSSAKKTRSHLSSCFGALERHMCSVKLALFSKGSDAEANENDVELSGFFCNLNTPKINESYRAYILINDGVQLANYLEAVYSAIASSISDSEA